MKIDGVFVDDFWVLYEKIEKEKKDPNEQKETEAKNDGRM